MGKLNHLYPQDLPHRAVAAAIPTTAQDIKYSEFTVRRAMKNLRKAGLLEPEQRYRGNGGQSSPLFDYHVFNMLLP